MAFESVFFQAFIYLSAALVAVLVGRRLGLGAVLGYLIAGAAIGPWGTGWIGGGGSEQVTHFAEFGVVMMLFLVGLELRPTELWRMRREIFGLGSLQVIFSALALGGLATAFGFGWKPGLAIGLILAMSSTAIVLQCLSEKNLMRAESGQNAFAVLLFQDLAVIPIIALLPMLAPSGGTPGAHAANDWMAGWPAWGRALTTLGAVVLIVVVARLATRPLFRAIARTRQREAFTAAALLMIIGIALLMTKVGLSAALGAFVAGVVLANSEYRHELETDLEPFKGLLLGLFFLGVGIGIDFGHIHRNLWTVVGLTAGLLVVKGVIIFTLARLKGSKCEPSLVVATALAGGGEFAFVLINLAGGLGVFSETFSKTLVAGVAMSMATTPLLILLSHRFTSRRAAPAASQRESDVKDEGAPVIICGFGRFGHAVGRLLRTQGFKCTVLDNDPDQIDTLRNIGIPVFFGDAARPDLLATAGAAHAKILVIALKDTATTLKITATAKKHFPHLTIFVRAYGRTEAYELIEAGQEHIYRDTIDSSLTLGADVLRALGIPAYTAYRAAKIYKRNDEAAVRVMALHRHDREKFLSVARESVRTFENLMKSDLSIADDAWAPPPPGPDPEENPPS